MAQHSAHSGVSYQASPRGQWRWALIMGYIMAISECHNKTDILLILGTKIIASPQLINKNVVTWKHLRITGPLWGESTFRILQQKPIMWRFAYMYNATLGYNASFDASHKSDCSNLLNKQSSCWWFESP